MSLRFSSLLAVGAMSLSASAQTAPGAPVVPRARPPIVFQSPRLPQTAPDVTLVPAPNTLLKVPISPPLSPTPLNGATQNIFGVDKPRFYHIHLRFVRPSIMAYWLDPKHQPIPRELENDAIAQLPHYKEGDTVTIPSPLPRAFALPAGVGSIGAIDPQSAMLVSATPRDFELLRQIVALLDRPASAPQIEFETSIYWLDSLDPGARLLGEVMPRLRAANADELVLLEQLKGRDRAARSDLGVIFAAQNTPTTIPLSLLGRRFLLNDASTRLFLRGVPLYDFRPSLPQSDIDPGIHLPFKPSPFEHSMPLIRPDKGIDPGIQPPQQKQSTAIVPSFIVPDTPQIGLSVLPISNIHGDLLLQIEGLGLPSTSLSLGQNQSLLLSGSAKTSGLVPPSPRFDTFVLKITPHWNIITQNPQP